MAHNLHFIWSQPPLFSIRRLQQGQGLVLYFSQFLLAASSFLWAFSIVLGNFSLFASSM